MTTQDDPLQQREHEDGLPANRLTRAEIKELRELLESDRRARWAWSTGRIWATWVTGSIIAVYSLYDTLEKAFKKLFGG